MDGRIGRLIQRIWKKEEDPKERTNPFGQKEEEEEKENCC